MVKRIAELASEHHVDAVLVAGDVFETNAVSNETIHGLIQAMEPFKGPWASFRAIMTRLWRNPSGAGSVSSVRPANLHIALTADRRSADGLLVVLPAPLLRRHEPEDITSEWDTISTPAGAIRVGLGHGSIENRFAWQGRSTQSHC